MPSFLQVLLKLNGALYKILRKLWLLTMISPTKLDKPLEQVSGVAWRTTCYSSEKMIMSTRCQKMVTLLMTWKSNFSSNYWRARHLVMSMTIRVSNNNRHLLFSLDRQLNLRWSISLQWRWNILKRNRMQLMLKCLEGVDLARMRRADSQVPTTMKVRQKLLAISHQAFNNRWRVSAKRRKNRDQVKTVKMLTALTMTIRNLRYWKSWI